VIWIGLDDTDTPGAPGTGQLARELAAYLGLRYPVYGVTRHQLSRDPHIPMTAKNSAAVVHLLMNEPERELIDEVVEWIAERAAPESEPGVCLAWAVPEQVTAFGRRAQQEIVTRKEALALAEGDGLLLRNLRENGRGIIGALAAVGLAATGNDGRFVLYRHLRDLRGVVSVASLLREGVARVQAVTGEILTQGLVDTQGKLRPSLVDGRPVLWVERMNDRWVAVRKD